MKILLVKGSLILILLQFSCFSSGQTITQQLNSEEISNRVAYVHGNDFVLAHPHLVTVYGKILTERIEYRVVAQEANEKYPLLSSFPLLTKVNAGIQGANFTNFNVMSFNPMVYNVDFFSDKTQLIRIDNTNYIMVIHPNKIN